MGATDPVLASDGIMEAGRARQLLTGALLIAMSTVAFETTVVGAALPSIAGELQGIALYPWVFSGYLLTTTTTAPLYGKMSDVFGRRPLFFLGLTIFTLGTFLCGLSWKMPMLVIARLIQGVGAGAVMPLTLTVMGDIYSIQDRVRVQAVTSSMWGFFSLIGPSVGALMTQYVSWRWVFWSNLPLCLLSIMFLGIYLKEKISRRVVTIDYAGAVTLTAGLVCLLLVALEGGRSLPWGSLEMYACITAGVALLVVFGFVERRAPEPILPFAAFRLRPVAVGNAGNVLVGLTNFVLASFVPLLVQGVRGDGATGTSAVLTPLASAWSITAIVSGRIYLALGFRMSAFLGTGTIALGCIGLAMTGTNSPLWVISLAMGVTGIGLGLSSTAFLYAPQGAVPWNQRGAVTSSTQFARNIAGAIGVAIGGGLLNSRLLEAAEASGATRSEAGPLVSQLLSASNRAQIDPVTAAKLTEILGSGLMTIITVLAGISVAGTVVMIAMARDLHPAHVKTVEAIPVHD